MIRGILERETRLEFTLHLFENIKRLRDPLRLMYRFLYRFRRFGNFRPLRYFIRMSGVESNPVDLPGYVPLRSARQSQCGIAPHCRTHTCWTGPQPRPQSDNPVNLGHSLLFLPAIVYFDGYVRGNNDFGC